MAIYNTMGSIPFNKPLWACAYYVDNETESKLICKPVHGELVQENWDTKFVPYKKGTTEKRTSGFIYWENKDYADTQEEAIALYNNFVEQRIDSLKKLLAIAEADKIQHGSIDAKNVVIYDEFENPPPTNTPIWAFAYYLGNNKTVCKPVLGEITEEGTGIRSLALFVPYKTGTTEKRASGQVSTGSRLFTLTEEEAITMYNELVEKRIERLKSLLQKVENDKIK